MNETAIEQRAIQLSQVGALALAALGFAFAFIASSDAIMLDGVYNLIMFTMALVSRWVAAVVRRCDDAHFPFGYGGFEPLLNITKGLVIAFVELFALYSAIQAILGGGRHSEAGLGVVYALIAAAACFALALYQRRAYGRSGSSLLQVDAKNWLIDAAISSAVAVAFFVAWQLQGSRFEIYLPYTDPAIVLMLVLILLPIPVGIIRQNLKELLLAAPAPAYVGAVQSAIAPLLQPPEVSETLLRVIKSGRRPYFSLYLMISPDSRLAHVSAQDGHREALRQTLMERFPGIIGDIVYTSDRQWASSPGIWDR